MLNFVHFDQLVTEDYIREYKHIFKKEKETHSPNIIETSYGLEHNFNFTAPSIKKAFSSFLQRDVTLIKNKSGVLVEPHNCLIQYDEFNTLNEWCCVVCLENTTFNILYHKKSGAKSALDETRLNYRNIIEWDYTANIILKPGEGIFFRPWLFHSLENGLLQKFKMYVN